MNQPQRGTSLPHHREGERQPPPTARGPPSDTQTLKVDLHWVRSVQGGYACPSPSLPSPPVPLRLAWAHGPPSPAAPRFTGHWISPRLPPPVRPLSQATPPPPRSNLVPHAVDSSTTAWPPGSSIPLLSRLAQVFVLGALDLESSGLVVPIPG